MDFNEIRKKLQQSGSINEIYDAFDTDDMVVLVRAATRALIKAECMQINRGNHLTKKISRLSSMFRNQGNNYYVKGEYRLALWYYNRALAHAPADSNESMLAYANRSAVMFNIRYFTACLKDIEHCLSIGCPKVLAEKLRNRWSNTLDLIQEELLHDILTTNSFIDSVFKFESKRNVDVPCASADVKFLSQNGAKRVTAGKDIKTGTVVSIERAFVSMGPYFTYQICYYCLRLTPLLYPCIGCALALFCSDDCRQKCMIEYHRIECPIEELIFTVLEDTSGELLVIRSAIKLSLKMGWDALITASEDIGSTRMRTATVRQTYNFEDPLSILSYNDDDKLIVEGRLFNGSILCARALHCLEKVPDYFPKEPTKRVAAKEAMSRIMLHLYMTFTNKLRIKCSSYNFRSKEFEVEVSSNLGWFSMCSKLKHSCEPNLLVVALNDSVALVALRAIKKDEELTISYVENAYYKCDIHPSRALCLFIETRHLCNCQMCIGNKVISFSVNNMTDRETELVSKLRSFSPRAVEECYKNACRALDSFPMYSEQHRLAYILLRTVMRFGQCKQTDNRIYALDFLEL